MCLIITVSEPLCNQTRAAYLLTGKPWPTVYFDLETKYIYQVYVQHHLSTYGKAIALGLPAPNAEWTAIRPGRPGVHTLKRDLNYYFHIIGNKLYNQVVSHIIAGSQLKGRVSKAEERWVTHGSWQSQNQTGQCGERVESPFWVTQEKVISFYSFHLIKTAMEPDKD